MSMVQFSPIALNFGYDFVLLVHFLGHPVAFYCGAWRKKRVKKIRKCRKIWKDSKFLSSFWHCASCLVVFGVQDWLVAGTPGSWSGQTSSGTLLFTVRVEICRDRHDRRSCKICASCVNFSRKQRNFSHNLHKTTRFTPVKCDYALKLLKFYTLS